ncbi:MAG: M24 family metallopeptidase [Proteobacteria bacterium]|nr:M24 family metallopeptidase [Pseudomonadota bacterium]
MMRNDIALGMTPGGTDVSALGAQQLAFDEAEYARRLTRLREAMAAAGIDLMWVTSPEVVCWLHGYFASWYKGQSPMRYPQCFGTAVHVDHEHFIFFDNPTEMGVTQQFSVSRDNRWLPSREAAPNLDFIMGELEAEGWLKGTVGMEFWSYLPNRAISTMFEGAFRAHGANVVDATAVTRGVRRVKSAAEIAAIEEAVRICAVGHQTIMDNLRPGITELDLFGQVMAAMMVQGGEFPALIPIFNAHPMKDGVPVPVGHGMAGRRVIQEGEYLGADLCGVFKRYHANVCRGYVVGEVPRKLAELTARAAGVFDVIESEVKAGMTVAEVIAVLKRYYDDAGLTGTPGWVLGYEMGLSLPPDWVGDFYFHFMDTKYLDRVFEENMVTNFESIFSTSLIDMVVYGRDGSRVLNGGVPRELQGVG